MPCDTRFRYKGQTISQRKAEVYEAVVKLNAQLAAGKVKPKISSQGGITFEGWSEADRGGITDACAYRRIMSIGGALAKAQIVKAEMLAGRVVNRQAVGQGLHSHDNGATWHDHKG